jgi:hypothetical protein
MTTSNRNERHRLDGDTPFVIDGTCWPSIAAYLGSGVGPADTLQGRGTGWIGFVGPPNEHAQRAVAARYSQHPLDFIDLAGLEEADLSDVTNELESAVRPLVAEALRRARTAARRRVGTATTAGEVTALADHDHAGERVTAVVHPLAAPSVIEHLADDPDPSVRAATADLIGTGMLGRLGADGSRFVRRVVARRPDCPAAVVAALAADRDVGVRHGVALNEAAGREVLEALLADPTDLVAGTARRRLAGGRFGRPEPARPTLAHRVLFELALLSEPDPSFVELEPNLFSEYPFEVDPEDLPFDADLLMRFERLGSSYDADRGGTPNPFFDDVVREVRRQVDHLRPWWSVRPT